MSLLTRLSIVAMLAVLVLIPSAAGAPATIGSALSQLDRVGSFVAGARARDPGAVQDRYEAARELQELLAGQTTATACVPLLKALESAAAAHVLAAEGFDRIDRALERRGESLLASSLRRVGSNRTRCPRGTRLTEKPLPLRLSLLTPLTGEPFFGKVRARCVCAGGPRTVEVYWNGRLIERSRAEGQTQFIGRSLVGRVTPGHGDLEFRIVDDAGKLNTSAFAENVWLLPRSANVKPVPEREDRALVRTLATLAGGFPGYAGISVYELATGRSGGWNEDARFPAASLVKLGVLVAALDRFGPKPVYSSAAYDMKAMAAWSSNLGANRLLELLGHGDLDRGRRIVEARLRRMGATSSTYPGDYRVGTSVGSDVAAPHEPPLVSQRTTTARDMTRVLATLQAAETGVANARRAAGLSAHEAKVALNYLLSSEPRGDNLGLFRPSLPEGTPAAQKHGWISSARHSAAIVYGPKGPVVVVVLTYRDGLSLARARELGARVLAAAGLN